MNKKYQLLSIMTVLLLSSCSADLSQKGAERAKESSDVSGLAAAVRKIPNRIKGIVRNVNPPEDGFQAMAKFFIELNTLKNSDLLPSEPNPQKNLIKEAILPKFKRAYYSSVFDLYPGYRDKMKKAYFEAFNPEQLKGLTEFEWVKGLVDSNLPESRIFHEILSRILEDKLKFLSQADPSSGAISHRLKEENLNLLNIIKEEVDTHIDSITFEHFLIILCKIQAAINTSVGIKVVDGIPVNMGVIRNFIFVNDLRTIMEQNKIIETLNDLSKEVNKIEPYEGIKAVNMERNEHIDTLIRVARKRKKGQFLVALPEGSFGHYGFSSGHSEDVLLLGMPSVDLKADGYFLDPFEYLLHDLFHTVLILHGTKNINKKHIKAIKDEFEIILQMEPEAFENWWIEVSHELAFSFLSVLKGEYNGIIKAYREKYPKRDINNMNVVAEFVWEKSRKKNSGMKGSLSKMARALNMPYEHRLEQVELLLKLYDKVDKILNYG